MLTNELNHSGLTERNFLRNGIKNILGMNVVRPFSVHHMTFVDTLRSVKFNFSYLNSEQVKSAYKRPATGTGPRNGTVVP